MDGKERAFVYANESSICLITSVCTSILTFQYVAVIRNFLTSKWFYRVPFTYKYGWSFFLD